MTDNDKNSNTQNWRTKQIWIKDALSKSGTELMEISRTNTSTIISQQQQQQQQRSQSSVNVNGNGSQLSLLPSSSKAAAALAAAAAAPVAAILSRTATNVPKNGVGRKTVKKTNGQESPPKMVYYQSTPLIVKTEQPSQAQFCTPLRTTTPTATYSSTTASSMSPSPQVTLLPSGGSGLNLGNYHQQLLPIHAQQQNTITPTLSSSHHFSISENNDTIILQQQQQSHGTSITINNNGHHHQQQQQHQNQQQQHSQNILLTNIKQEQLPPSITLYATTTTSSTAATAAAPLQLTTSSTTLATTNTATTTTNRRGQNAGPKPQFKCEQCGMIFGSKSAHTSHVKSHAKAAGEMTNLVGNNGYNAASTATTNTTTTQSNTTTIEMNEAGMPVGIPKMPQITPNAAGGSDPYQCNVCQKTFAVPARLIRHYRTHTGERPFECEFCHKLFSVKENLQVHRRIHTKERPYKCDVCGRAFEHSGKLHRHMRIHTGERPHKCSVCQKTFIQSGQLVIHMRTHTGEKPYKCPVEGCGKGFTCSKQLKVHSRTHTGEKPYHCDICFRDFGYNHVLKLHRVQHYGSKCYKCTICDKTFKSKKEMEAHIKGHANEIPDDEETNVGSVTGDGGVGSGVTSGQTSSISSSSGEMTNSAPGSPQSPPVLNVSTIPPVKTRKPRQPRTPRAKAPPSPSSPSSTYSPPSSMASASRLSAGSPSSSIASPAPASFSGYATAAATIETDNQYNNSRDSGVATNYSASSSNAARQLASHHTLSLNHVVAPTFTNVDELPTDLSKTTTTNYYQQSSPSTTSAYNCMRQRSPVPQSTLAMEPTINPALLEAATIASEEEVTKAALQILQLQRSSTSSSLQVQPPTLYNTAYDLHQDLDHQDDDARQANELIAHYKRGDLAKHGLHKRYAPVPKFESSLMDNEIIVRTVEAAIAPLRSSTESPDRSSSPESDSLMLVDRDVMTLPLRKRKLYMNGEHEENAALALEQTANNSNSNGSEVNGSNQKVMRMSSVIQFAKAS